MLAVVEGEVEISEGLVVFILHDLDEPDDKNPLFIPLNILLEVEELEFFDDFFGFDFDFVSAEDEEEVEETEDVSEVEELSSPIVT